MKNRCIGFVSSICFVFTLQGCDLSKSQPGDVQKEINTVMQEKNNQENQLFDQSTINTYMVSMFSSIKNKYPEVTFNDLQNIQCYIPDTVEREQERTKVFIKTI